MILDIDPGSPVPVSEQVRSQLAEMILSGALATGARLPTIRQLAADLGLAPGTIARVYSSLEAEHLVQSRVRHGTVVAPLGQPAPAVVEERADEAARAFVLTARRLGLDLDATLASVRTTWHSLGEG